MLRRPLESAQHAGGNRHADRIVDEGEEQVLPDVAHRGAAEHGRARRCRARSPFTSVTPALAIATSVPVPIAMPTSAAASAGASLTPSPAMATTWPSRLAGDATMACLSAGSTSASTSSMPRRRATASAVVAVVAGQHDDAQSEARAGWRSASGAVGLIGSAMAITPAACHRSRRTARSRRPAATPRLWLQARRAAMPRSRMQAGIAQRDGVGRHFAGDALAGDRSESRPARPGAAPRSRAAATMAAASGCSLARSRRRGERQQIVLGPLARRHDRDDARPAFGQRAGLVDHERIDLLQALQRLGRADQHAGARALADADHDRHRRREAERAGAGDDQHRDRGDQRIGERRGRSPDRPGRECQQRDGDHRGHEPAGDRRRRGAGSVRASAAPRPPWRRCGPAWCPSPTRSARMTSAPVPLTVPPITRSPGCFATGIDSPVTIDFVDGARCLRAPRHRPARCRRAARAADRPDGSASSATSSSSPPARDAAGGLRRQVQQRANGAAGLLARPQFQHLTQQDQDGDDRRGLEIHRDPAVRSGSRPGTGRARSSRRCCRPRPHRCPGRSA